MSNSPETLAAWQSLRAAAEQAPSWRIADFCKDESRLATFSHQVGELHVDLSKHLVDDNVLSMLLNLAEETGVSSLARAMFSGDAVNTAENRQVLHTAMRDPSHVDNATRGRIEKQHAKMRQLSEQIRSGDWKLSGGQRVTDVINIGIGGSDLGPRMANEALREYQSPDVRCHYIANVDGAEIRHLTGTLNAASTAVVISSKSFTTSETMLNAETTLAWLSEETGITRPASSPHVFAVTANPDAAGAYGIAEEQILTFDESIGGRYSVWSCIGFPLAISIGFNRFREMLDGAALMDRHFLEAAPRKNVPLLMGLIGIWYNNFVGWRTHAVIPYCQRLKMFVDHLQQLDMESNGKSGDRAGEAISIDTGPIIWGQTGTNGQHAFFQLLHQGSQVVPVDFIAAIRDATSSHEHHRVLLANMIAQSEALMTGKASESAHTNYPGNRPSTVILLNELTPAALGSLLALYEHKVFVQGAVWHINSFDQWGVELGKVLANDILEGGGKHDAATTDLLARTGLD